MQRSKSTRNTSKWCRGRRLLLLIAATLTVIATILHVVVWWKAYYSLLLLPGYGSQQSSYRGQLLSIDRDLFPNRTFPQDMQWLRDYVAWHSTARKQLFVKPPWKQDPNNSSSPPPPAVQVLLLYKEGHGNGLADRLRDLPFWLWQAHRSHRLLLWEWRNPSPPLTEFLWPAALDWTVLEGLRQGQLLTGSITNQLEQLQQPSPILETQPGAAWGDKVAMAQFWRDIQRDGTRFCPEVYKVLLRLAPPVQAAFERTVDELGLTIASPYLAAHVRARYPGFLNDTVVQHRSYLARSVDADGMKLTPETTQLLQSVSQHAVDCVVQRAKDMTAAAALANNASTSQQQSSPSTPMTVYFASDTNEAVRMMVTSKQQQQPTDPNIRIVGMLTPWEKMHLGRNNHMALHLRRTPPSALYPTFVDLWILAGASCWSLSRGLYGAQAVFMGLSATTAERNSAGSSLEPLCVTALDPQTRIYDNKMNPNISEQFCLMKGDG